MPIYNFKCGYCNETREYMVPRPGLEPLRCLNEKCEETGRFKRVYDGEGASIRSNRSNKKLKGLHSLVIDINIFPLS